MGILLRFGSHMRVLLWRSLDHINTLYLSHLLALTFVTLTEWECARSLAFKLNLLCQQGLVLLLILILSLLMRRILGVRLGSLIFKSLLTVLIGGISWRFGQPFQAFRRSWDLWLFHDKLLKVSKLWHDLLVRDLLLLRLNRFYPWLSLTARLLLTEVLRILILKLISNILVLILLASLLICKCLCLSLEMALTLIPEVRRTLKHAVVLETSSSIWANQGTCTRWTSLDVRRIHHWLWIHPHSHIHLILSMHFPEHTVWMHIR